MKKTALQIVKKLKKHGYEAYWAGGCVRDLLLGVEPKDYDIVTSAKPDEIKKILKTTIEVGREFGVMVANYGKYHFEVATFRSEGKYKDARRPDKVFWSSAKEDAKRRDFTVNGMFYDPVLKKIIDYVDGQTDLKNRIIRFIGNTNDRIKEDHLRILRAVRFKNTLGFKYEKRALEAVKNNAYLIESVSKERIRDELNKMFYHKNRANALEDLSNTGLLKYILPEIEKLKGIPQPKIYHKEGDVFIHTIWTLRALADQTPLTLIWAALLHDSGKPATISFPHDKNDRIRFNKHVKYSAGIASKLCRRLKFPNIERDLIVWLVKSHMILGDIPKMGLAKQRRWLMDRRFPWLLKLAKADALGTKPANLVLYQKNLQLYEKVKKLHEIEKKQPKHLPLISGKDLIYHFKFNEGPEIGRLLKIIEDAQLEGKLKSKSEALKFVKNNLG